MKSDNRCEFIRDRSFTTDAGLWTTGGEFYC